MNYLDLINKCLVELNYRKVNSLSELIKNEHEKIKNIISVINSEVCTSYNWNFLLKKTNATLPQGHGDITNPISGKIIMLKIDNNKYQYDANFEKFFTNKQPPQTYSIFNDKILLPQFEEDKNVDMIYYTNKYVKDEQGIEKTNFENFNDESLIPMPFVEPLIVYGTCMRLKGNPQHPRFNYWLSMYKNALANLIADSNLTTEASPKVNPRRF